jgi:uncharacterized protein with LGFP repeats
MIMLLALSLQAAAASTPPGCNTPESHQWDFWVGSWEVRPKGEDKVIAHSLIEKRYAGCAIRENWKPDGKEIAGGGRSLSFYDTRRKQWRQVWVDSSGSRVDLDGGFKDGVMTIVGNWANYAGPAKDALVAMHYRLMPNGEVRQWAENSPDGGKTWRPAFDFLYRRAALPDFK